MLREHSDYLCAPETRDEVECYHGLLARLIAKAQEAERAAAGDDRAEA
jgi:hypothetical protein